MPVPECITYIGPVGDFKCIPFADWKAWTEAYGAYWAADLVDARSSAAFCIHRGRGPSHCAYYSPSHIHEDSASAGSRSCDCMNLASLFIKSWVTSNIGPIPLQDLNETIVFCVEDDGWDAFFENRL